MKNKKILTLDDLYSFFSQQNQTVNFNASDSGYKIAVQVPANFEYQDSENDGFLHVVFKVNHLYENLNKSYISEEAQLEALPSLHYRPVLAAYTEIDEDGTLDFTSHEIDYDEDGNPKYIEQPIGTFINPDGYHLEYDEEQDKTYVIADAVIYSDYCAPACEIIRRKNGSDVSCELIISELSYDSKNKLLNLDKFRYNGVTCLGCNPVTKEPVKPGMAGARLDIADFSEEKNSVFYNREDELIKTLHSLQETLAKFEHKENSKKGGENELKLEELLKKYGKSEADLDFDYSTLSDEELEAKFAELFDTEEADTPTDDPVDEDDSDEGTGDPADNPEETNIENPVVNSKKYSRGESGDAVLSFEISHEDVRSALYALLSTWEENDNEWYWIEATYDDYFIYSNWEGTKIYRHAYTVDGDNITLSDERTELFKEYLTLSEKEALAEMRSNYEVLQKKIKDFESERDNAEKEKIFKDENYEILADEKDFKDLIKNSANFSVDEVRMKADLILAAYVKREGQFRKNESVKPQSKVGVNFDFKQEESYKPYGDLFDE